MSCPLPFILPHELAHHLLQENSPDTLAGQNGMSSDTRKHMAEVASAIPGPLLGIGIWADGVPCNWDRSESLEVVSIFFPGFQNREAAMRIPFTVVPKKFVDQHTYDDIMTVLVWSMEALASGSWPAARHDEAPWTPKDTIRKQNATMPLHIRGVLCEVRGDWSMYSSVFRLGGWSKKNHSCWKCDCNRDDMFDFTLSAPWRTKKMSHIDMLVRWRSEGLEASPICGCPFFHTGLFKIDWLHTVDLGCAADWIGNLLNFVLPKLAGKNKKEQCSQLVLQIKEYYTMHPDVPGRYNNIVLTMFRHGKKGFKLRGKAAEVRGLVGFSVEFAQKYLSKDNPLEATVLQGTMLLASCYNCLSKSACLDSLPDSARKFCVVWKALADSSEDPKWRIKPKAHLFCELAEYTADRPSDTWCYREEEFGGTVAQLSRIRGGKVSPVAICKNVLLKFMCENTLPSL